MSREKLDEISGGETSGAGVVDSSEIPALAVVAHDRVAVVVHVEEDKTTTCSGSLSVYRSLLASKLGTATYHFINFSKIFLVTTALFARWLHQFFLELNRYGVEPTKEAQETWVGLVTLGIAAFLSMIVKLLNYRYSETKYADYLYAGFSSSLFYYGLDLLSNEGKIGSMPLGCFVVSSCIFIPIVVSLFYKWTVFDSHSKLMYSLRQLNEFNPPKYPLASRNERRLNIITGLKYGVPSVTTFIWNVNREVFGKTVETPTWQKCLIAMYFLIAGKIGFELTHHPKFFQGFAAFSKVLKNGSLSYAALSGIFYLAVVYQCENKKYCLDGNFQTYLNYICFSLALMMGLYSGATTRFQFEKNHQGNLDFIAAVQNFPAAFNAKKTEVIDGCGSAFQKMGNGLTRCFQFFKEKIENGCHSDSVSQSTENDALIA